MCILYSRLHMAYFMALLQQRERRKNFRVIITYMKFECTIQEFWYFLGQNPKSTQKFECTFRTQIPNVRIYFSGAAPTNIPAGAVLKVQNQFVSIFLKFECGKCTQISPTISAYQLVVNSTRYSSFLQLYSIVRVVRQRPQHCTPLLLFEGPTKLY